MKLLYLCNKLYWERKIPRTRFYAVTAMKSFADVHCSGVGFDDWNGDLSVSDNIERMNYRPDWILVYKPTDYCGWEKNRIPVATTFNDAWETKTRIQDIRLPNCSLVVMHHANEMNEWEKRCPDVKFVNIPYPVEPTVFHPDSLVKHEYDLLLTGCVHKDIYPLRYRFALLIEQNAFYPYHAHIRKHSGYRLSNPDEEALMYAKALCSAKMCLVDTSKYGYAAEKYHEIPACGSVLCGNLPQERQNDFNRIMVVVDNSWPEARIVATIRRYLDDSNLWREKRQAGLEYASRFTTSWYAKRFIDALR